MPKITDPITDTDYDPIDDPFGTLMKAAGIVLGIGMTLVLFGISQSTVVPFVSSLLDPVPGIDDGQETGNAKVVFGGE